MPYALENQETARNLLMAMVERLNVGPLPAFCTEPGSMILLFGRGIVAGAMGVGEIDDRAEAYLLAETERAARDLLSWFAPRKELTLHIPQEWLIERARFQFDLEPVSESVFAGRRRQPRLPQGVSEVHAKVDSQKHPAVDMARSLQTERGRDELGLYAAHGPLLLSRAIAARAPLEYVLYTPKLSSEPEAAKLLQGLVDLRIPHYLVTDGLLRKCVDTAYVPPVLSVLRKQNIPIRDLFLGPRSLVLVAESVEEAGNLGMILRTADAVAADAVLVCGTGCDPYAWKTVTGSRGSIFRVPLVHIRDTAYMLQELKKKHINLVAADLSGDRSHFELEYSTSTAFLVGNESDGLSQTALDLSDVRVRIPMPGEPDSLNVGVSAGVLLYEALRQRV